MSLNEILLMLGQMETSQETFDSSHPSVPMRQQEQITNELFSKLDYNGWNESNQLLHGISRTFSCPPSFDSDEIHKVVTTLLSAPASALESKRIGTNTGNGNKKRKDENDGEIIDAKNKRIKRELDSQVMIQRKQAIHPNTATKPTKLNSSGNKKKEETLVDGSKEASKVSDVVERTDYIHVRARRGQATDSHSLAERLRREKISARMKYLQDLVPGCNKISSKAGILDEIINYVQCLQRQVEFLSMKMAAVNPIFDFTPEGFFIDKENIHPVVGSSPVEKGVSSELIDPSYPLPNTLQQSTTLHPTLCRTISAPITTNDIFVNTNSHVPLAPYAWNADLQSLRNGEFC